MFKACAAHIMLSAAIEPNGMLDDPIFVSDAQRLKTDVAHFSLGDRRNVYLFASHRHWIIVPLIPQYCNGVNANLHDVACLQPGS